MNALLLSRRAAGVLALTLGFAAASRLPALAGPAASGKTLENSRNILIEACVRRFAQAALPVDAEEARKACALGPAGEAALASRLSRPSNAPAPQERPAAATEGFKRGSDWVASLSAGLAPMMESGRVGEIYGERAAQAGNSSPVVAPSPLSDASLAAEDPRIKKGLNYKEIEGRLFVKGRSDKGRIAASDVTQGELGDCYYLASLAAIANTRPSVIRNMIHDNRDGTFSVTFHTLTRTGKSGKPKFTPVTIRVDDKFPEKNHRPVFAQVGDKSGGSRELWVMAAEKAFAAYKGGSYRGIEGGLPSQAMQEITGTVSPAARASSVTLDQLARWKDKKYAMAVGTRSQKELTEMARRKKLDPLYAAHVLVPGHAYWIENVDKKARTVTIANPWGWKEQHVTMSETQFHRVLDSFFLTSFN